MSIHSVEEVTSVQNRWIRIGGTLLIGLFVAYLDRSNLSIGLSSMMSALGVTGARTAIVSSLALTAFSLGYAFANFFGGIFTYRANPKIVVISVFVIWSITTLLTGWVASIGLLVFYRIILGVGEGVYWPQQSRFANAWFHPDELTKANSVIQYYGEFISLALGFAILTPIYNALGWRSLFFITGALGIIVIVPLFSKMLKAVPQEQEKEMAAVTRQKLTLQSLGGPRFLLIIFSYLANGMLFWGITLWLPLVVKSLGFHGMASGYASAFPYLLAVILAIPMAIISDRTGKRTVIAALGLIVAGILLVFLPETTSDGVKLALITIAMGYYASSFTPNIWAIIQSTVDRTAIGPAAGIVNGIGAGIGGVLSGWIVGLLTSSTGSYLPGFVVLGIISVLGGLSLIVYGRLASRHVATHKGTALQH